jgi:hypothetical protein
MHTTKVLINGPRGFKYVEAETLCPKGAYRPFGYLVNTLEDDTPAWAIFTSGQVLSSPVNTKRVGYLNLNWQKARAKKVVVEGGKWVPSGPYTMKQVGGTKKRIEHIYSSGNCSWGGMNLTVKYGTSLIDQFYVLVHELTHACDEHNRETSHGHGPSFWSKLCTLATAYDMEQLALWRDGNYHKGSKFMPFVVQDGGRSREEQDLRSIEGIKSRIRAASRKLGTSVK